MLPVARAPAIEPYFLFLFCGILPWTWFHASLAGVLGRAHRGRQPDQEGAVPGRGAAGGHRARQPGPLPARPAHPARCSCVWNGQLSADRAPLPLPILVQLVFTLGLALSSPRSPCTSATSRTSWPTCCTSGSSRPPCSTATRETGPHARRCCGSTRCPTCSSPTSRCCSTGTSTTGAACSAGGGGRARAFAAGRLPVRPAARHPGGGGVTAPAAVVARDVTKVYRRFLHQNQFRTLKSALLTGSLLSDLAPDQTFTALDGVSFEVPAGIDLRRHRRERLGQVDAAEAAGRHHQAHARHARAWTAASPPSSSWGPASTPRSAGARTSPSTGSCSGLTRREVEERFDEIVAFAELERVHRRAR